MFNELFGSKYTEKILFYLLRNRRGYGNQLARALAAALSPIQKSLDRLENGGILVSYLEGKTRLYEFNPRYPFLEELKNLLEKAYTFIPKEQKERYYEPKVRKRPRRKANPSKHNFESIQLLELAARVSKVMHAHDLECILVGGGCVSIYSKNRYQSYDLDEIARWGKNEGHSDKTSRFVSRCRGI